jgi:hypothetical protein
MTGADGRHAFLFPPQQIIGYIGKVSVDTEFIQGSDPFQQFLDLARRVFGGGAHSQLCSVHSRCARGHQCFNIELEPFIIDRCMDAFASATSYCCLRPRRVARELGTGGPNVSRHIAALERHLGTRLLHRSTRKLTLTPEAERYYSETRRVIEAITEVGSNARRAD